MDNTDRLIEKLISSTQAEKIKWRYLTDLLGIGLGYIINSLTEENKLHNYIDSEISDIKNDALHETTGYSIKISASKSFHIQYQNGFIFLISKYSANNPNHRYLCIATQKDSTSDIIELNTINQYQSILLRLNMIIERKIGLVDKYINDFLNDPST